MVLAAPGSIAPHTKKQGVYFEKEEGGRHTVFNGYRPGLF